MVSAPGDAISGRGEGAGEPAPWERGYGREARKAVGSCVGGTAWSSPDSGTGALEDAGSVVIFAAALSGAIFAVMAWLFSIGTGFGMIGSIVASTLCWWWLSRAVQPTDRECSPGLRSAQVEASSSSRVGRRAR